ncbi:MAG: hypothetical protein GWM98_04995, partial [Nitrospinaceae bacterium]|nr:hypothetical protein [Nitrospinaceae bacterium]NIR53927.1 hypothetical protein [Nitrospinaceae bacterium]NIS84345.1 hypothetical protein [Nitrospinaceae bacterium]NIT81148.1 hypothetical protein [Nitrospinaceae bacterium]NIU43430.1 hypothetical protein [Nitrospinaceae bacterium]
MSKGWFHEEEPSPNKKKKFCDHKAAAVTIDYEIGIEHCSYCGALGHYNIDTDTVDWTLPEYLQKQNY